MIPGDLATRLRQLTENTVQPSPFIHKLPANLPELVPGQQFTAQIQNPLPDGSFQALVAGRTITLALPHSVKSGDVLELIVTGQQDEYLTARIAPPPTNADDAPQSTLSQTGRLISQLLTGRFGEQRATPLASGTPLLQAPPDKPQDLSPRLQQAVANSGLFYESHLKSWAEGKAALASLLREPHAKFMPGKSYASPEAVGSEFWRAAASTPMSDPRSASATIPTPSDEALLLQTVLGSGIDGTPTQEEPGVGAPTTALVMDQDLSQEPLAASGQAPENIAGEEKPAARDVAETNRQSGTSATRDQVPADEQSRPLGTSSQQTSSATAPQAQRIPDALMPLIYQQLEAMATHQVQYQFQAWPGMNVDWDVVDPEQGGYGGDETEKAWRSNIRLHLPKLGDVDALLVLGPQGLSIRLDTSSEASAERMRIAGQDLLDALAGAGLAVNALSVTEHANA